tara:strand:- start:106170 stop:106457 length:288 start_codon:yes stop_codon:yes gene_type:complete
MSVLFGEQGGATPGSIHVEMTTDLFGDVRHFIQRVHTAGFRGSRHPYHANDGDVVGFQFINTGTQFLQINFVAGIGFDADQRVTADSQHIGGFAQ